MRQLAYICLCLASCSGFTRSGAELDVKRDVFFLTNLLRSTGTSSCSQRGFCYIYESQNSQASANLGGIAAADTMCASDGARPSAATYTVKAFLAGSTRRASVSANAGDGQLDWVLLANQEYRQANGATVIGTTNSVRLFTFPLSAALVPNGTSFKTGLTATWTNSGNDCGSWATTAGNQDLGNGNVTGSTAIAGGVIACTNPGYYLLCVEQ